MITCEFHSSVPLLVCLFFSAESSLREQVPVFLRGSRSL